MEELSSCIAMMDLELISLLSVKGNKNSLTGVES